jgi:hypothetical protein
MALKLAWLDAKADSAAVSSGPPTEVLGAVGGAVVVERKETARWTTAVAEGAAKTEAAIWSPPFFPAAPAVRKVQVCGLKLAVVMPLLLK